MTSVGGGRNCSWTNDTWCSGLGKGTDWCNGHAGWCDHPDFKPKDCWQKSDNSSCISVSGCNWKTDQYSQTRCEVNWSGNCWQYSINSTCTTGGCWWRNETYGSTTSAWCSNNLDRCWSQYNESGCGTVTAVSCSWRNYSGGSGGTISCETSGNYCEPSLACLDARGTILSSYSCTNLKVCCSVNVI